MSAKTPTPENGSEFDHMTTLLESGHDKYLNVALLRPSTEASQAAFDLYMRGAGVEKQPTATDVAVGQVAVTPEVEGDAKILPFRRRS